jgi:acetyl esterase/lipase
MDYKKTMVIDSDGVINFPKFYLPISMYMSDEARASFINTHLSPMPLDLTNNTTFRSTTDKFFWQPLLEKARQRYSVDTESRDICGVPVSIVTPKEYSEDRHDHCVLINLHGGSFEIGSGGLGGLVESVPIAAVTRLKVISIDYRQSPEYRFPSACEDVAKVYTELLRSYQAKNIAIYGCSAGAILTSQAMAWFLKEGLPLPGAIGLFCAGADPRYAGDSRYITSFECTDTPPIRSGDNPPGLLPGYERYLEYADLGNPLVAPVWSPDTLSKFPPTLLISGTRAYDLSSAAYTHTQLVGLGVEAAIYVWDGMWHGFHYDVDLPESRQAFDIIAAFMRKQLAYI